MKNFVIKKKMFIDSVQWNHPSTTLVAGPSNSGKTTIISKILQHKNELFTHSNLKRSQENFSKYLKNHHYSKPPRLKPDQLFVKTSFPWF